MEQTKGSTSLRGAVHDKWDLFGDVVAYVLNGPPLEYQSSRKRPVMLKTSRAMVVRWTAARARTGRSNSSRALPFDRSSRH